MTRRTVFRTVLHLVIEYFKIVLAWLYLELILYIQLIELKTYDRSIEERVIRAIFTLLSAAC